MANMFYSTTDLKNLVSKKEFASVQMLEPKHGDDSITYKVGDDSWKTEKVSEFVSYAFGKSNLSAECEDGGVVITEK